MLFPVIGLVVGVIIGISSSSLFLIEYTNYISVGILASIYSILGGIKKNLLLEFNLKLFIWGFIFNTFIALIFVFLEVQLGIPFSMAAIVFFGGRIFKNFGDIRKYWLNN